MTMVMKVIKSLNVSLSPQELEQEKYHLRRRLEGAQEEHELRVSELQHDVAALQAQIQDLSSVQRQTDKEKSLLITTLTEQNQRLTTQLKEVTTQRDKTCTGSCSNSGWSFSYVGTWLISMKKKEPWHCKFTTHT